MHLSPSLWPWVPSHVRVCYYRTPKQLIVALTGLRLWYRAVFMVQGCVDGTGLCFFSRPSATRYAAVSSSGATEARPTSWLCLVPGVSAANTALPVTILQYPKLF